MIDGALAVRIAVEERRVYEKSLEGRYGEENKAKAERLGLRGIVEKWTEYSNKWIIVDTLTDEKCERPFKPMKLGTQKRMFAAGGTIKLWRHEGNKEGKVFGKTDKVFGKPDNQILIQWDDNTITEHDPNDMNLEVM
jgi:hypothetical protein